MPAGASPSPAERQASGWPSWQRALTAARASPSSPAAATAIDDVVRRWPDAHGIAGDVARKEDIHPIAMQLAAALGGVDVLINNASSLGPVPLLPLADTDCEDLEAALATNLLGPFRLTKALLGSLAASAREGRGGLIVNVSSDAAVNAYAGWGAYGASKAALLHLTRIWQAELGPIGMQVVSFDPGDMDTPLHAAAIPDADPSMLKAPAASARELVALIESVLAQPRLWREPAPRRWSDDSRDRAHPAPSRCPASQRRCVRPDAAHAPVAAGRPVEAVRRA